MKSLAAGALIFNDNNEFLIVNPTYKDMWEIPGGMIETGESPKEACKRELIEEIGFSLEIGKLLSVVYTPQQDSSSEKLQFIFDCGTLAKDKIESIKLNFQELSEWKFIAINEIEEYLNPLLGNRVKHALKNQKVNLNNYQDYDSLIT